MSFVFTFGYDHKSPDSGETLGRNYIEIDGDVESTRQVMLFLFNRDWAFQYPSKERAGVEKYRLTPVAWPHEVRHLNYTECGCPRYRIHYTAEGGNSRDLVTHAYDCVEPVRGD